MRLRGHEGITGVVFASGGHDLVGVLYLARGQAPKPTALLLHGCPGLEKNLDIAASLRDSGWNSLVFHYRGCWGSSGRYDLRTIPDDVGAAVGYLRSGDHPSVDPERIAVVGHSLGGWAAVLAAAADDRIRAVAVCGAVADLGAVRLSETETDWEITRFVAAGRADYQRQRDEAAAWPQPISVAASIAPRPLLIVHGAADEWIPVEQARALQGRAGQPCRYVEIGAANHSFAWHRGELCGLITGWLAGLDI